jgi:hypothetical protein
MGAASFGIVFCSFKGRVGSIFTARFLEAAGYFVGVGLFQLFEGVGFFTGSDCCTCCVSFDSWGMAGISGFAASGSFFSS